LNEVHRYIEKKQLKFVLCGSSARKLKKTGVNLLAGRALNRSMHPFVPEEFFNDMYFWAPAGGIETEVDFLLQRNREFIAVEAKSGRTFSEKWCKGLRAITDLNGLQRRIVVYPQCLFTQAIFCRIS